MINIINKYFHEYDFPYNDYLQKEKDNLVDFYTKNVNKDTYDVGLYQTPINAFFNKKINKIIEKYYIVKKSLYPPALNLYIQSNEPYITDDRYHNHIHHPFAICGVFYTNLPDEGGEFSFYHPPHIPQKSPIIIKPKINKLYLFPPWLYHATLQQQTPTPRISLNIGYISNSKAILKDYNIIW